MATAPRNFGLKKTVSGLFSFLGVRRPGMTRKSGFQSPQLLRNAPDPGSRSLASAIGSYRRDIEAEEEEVAFGHLQEAGFLGGEWVNVQSSNVAAIRFDKERLILEVRFLDGSSYEYFQVSPEEAESLYVAPSKGKWVWDHLRIRGTKLGHQKDYAYVQAASTIDRKWNATTQSAIAHGQEVDRQSQAALRGNIGQKKGANS